MANSTSAISQMYTPAAYTQQSQASSNLDKNGFLKLLTAQMKNQDPSSSQDPSQYFQTISQMSVVEQLTNLAAAQQVTNAQSLLGKTVTYTDSTGATTAGLVESVALGGDKPRVTIAGISGIDPAAITQVK
jgi:flagellar basal-body rod modification protein FlgD